MPNTNVTATRNSWKLCLPLPSQREKLQFKRDYSEAEYRKLYVGLIPEVMEDKWFIFMEKDVLYFHRSWTGVCIYQIQLEKSNNGYSVKEAWVNRDGQQYKQNDLDYDSELLTFLIENLLLGKSIPFPLSQDVVGKLPKGVQQHSVSGTGYREKIYKRKK